MAEQRRPENPHPRNRAVVSDDGSTIRLMVYAPDTIEPLGVVELSPEASVRLCADLFVAAATHMARTRGPVR